MKKQLTISDVGEGYSFIHKALRICIRYSRNEKKIVFTSSLANEFIGLQDVKKGNCFTFIQVIIMNS